MGRIPKWDQTEDGLVCSSNGHPLAHFNLGESAFYLYTEPGSLCHYGLQGSSPGRPTEEEGFLLFSPSSKRLIHPGDPSMGEMTPFGIIAFLQSYRRILASYDEGCSPFDPLPSLVRRHYRAAFSAELVRRADVSATFRDNLLAAFEQD